VDTWCFLKFNLLTDVKFVACCFRWNLVDACQK